MAQSINHTEFEKLVLQNSKPVLVDFWASWCGPCKMIAPLIDEVANDVNDFAEVYKVEVEGDNQPLAAQYGVRSIPSLLFFSNGEVKHQINGANITKEQLITQLKELSSGNTSCSTDSEHKG